MNAVVKEKINQGVKLNREELIAMIESGESLKEILNLSERDLTNLLVVGYELFNQGNYEDARVIFQGLEALGHDDPFVFTALGTMAAREDDLETAETYLNHALEMDPEDVVALTNRAELYLKKNEYEQAADDLKLAVELDVDECSPLSSRARVLALVTHELMDSVQKTA